MDHCATKEDVNLQMQIVREDFDKKIYESHVAIAKTISEIGARLDTLDFATLVKIVNEYKQKEAVNDYISSKKGFVMGIVALGASVWAAVEAFVWIIRHIK